MSKLVKLATALFLLSHTALADSEDGGEGPADLADLDTYMNGVVAVLMKKYNSASGVVTIVHGDEVVFSQGYGFQDIENRVPLDPASSMVRPGSISKLFTWVAVMQLVEQGKLNLDADVNEYLDTFQITDAFDEPITLRHVMTHTAGFEDGALGYLIVVDEDEMLPLAEAMRKFQPRRINPPGAQSSYSNYASALAGLIVANVSGQDFNDYVQANIFDVLGMQNSTFYEPLPARHESKEVIGYQAENGIYSGKPFELVAGFGPAGGLSASGIDMARFAQAIFNLGELDGARILREATATEMLTQNFAQDDRLPGMALGFYETDVNGVRIVGHGGDLFHYHADLAIDLENDIGIFAAFSGDGGSTVRASIVPAFYDKYFPRHEEPPVAVADFAERAEKYTGAYRFWRQNFSTIEKALALAPGITISATDNDTLALSFSEGAKQYVEVDTNLFRELNPDIALSPRFSPRLIAFQEDTNGSVTGMVIDGLPFMSLYRSRAYADTPFNAVLLGLSALIFVAVLLRLAYQWPAVRNMSGDERAAVWASVLVAVSNLLFFVVAAVVISAYGMELFVALPFAFKAMLILPIAAFALGLYQAYKAIAVWRGRLFGSVWARLRYSVVTLCALSMCWFYYYWNILGFQYLA